MTKAEALELTDLLRALWPSKFNWTEELIRTWAEGLARPQWNRDQAEAVIRQVRRDSSTRQPTFPQILARIADVHRQVRQRAPDAKAHGAPTPAEWAEIHADREAAGAWWHENRADREAIVADACAAYPMFAAGFRRFLAADFRPSLVQCQRLKVGFDAYHEHGPWRSAAPGPLAHELASAV